MATGFLQVMVTTQTAIPLENVKITVIDSPAAKCWQIKQCTQTAAAKAR